MLFCVFVLIFLLRMRFVLIDMGWGVGLMMILVVEFCVVVSKFVVSLDSLLCLKEKEWILLVVLFYFVNYFLFDFF